MVVLNGSGILNHWTINFYQSLAQNILEYERFQIHVVQTKVHTVHPSLFKG